MFISKAFPENRTFVKYSKLSFDDANLEIIKLVDNDDNVLSIDEWNKTNKQRIKVGIFLVLKKFIQVVKTFSNIDFQMIVSFDVNKSKSNELHAQAIEFLSKTLTMHVDGCTVSEFDEITDKVFFDKVNKIESPMTFEVTKDTIKNLNSISSVFSIDSSKDVIKFYTKKDPETNKWVLYAKDYKNNTYDYMLAYLKEGTGVKTDILILKNNFFIIAKSNDNNLLISISDITNNKIRIETTDNESITILGSLS